MNDRDRCRHEPGGDQEAGRVDPERCGRAELGHEDSPSGAPTSSEPRLIAPRIPAALHPHPGKLDDVWQQSRARGGSGCVQSGPRIRDP